MKVFSNLLLLAAIVTAKDEAKDKKKDAENKAKVADDRMTGSDDGRLKNALDMPQWELKTGGKRKGKFVM